MQSYHRDMMKLPDGKRVVSVFAALYEDMYSDDGTDTIFLPHSCEGLLRPWDPIPIPLRRDDLFLLYGDLVHAGGCTPLSKPASWWRRVLFLDIATISVTYSYTVGVRVPFWGLKESRDVDGPERCTISGCRRKAKKDCFGCRMPRLCATHEGELCLGCSQVSVGSKASAAASAPQALGFPLGVTCLLPILTSTLHLGLQPLPTPPPNPFRPHAHSNVRRDECPLGSWAHETETLELAKDQNITVNRVPPRYIMALRCQFGGFGMGRDDEQASIVRWDMGYPLQSMLDPRMGLTCGWLTETSKDGAYWCRCGQVFIVLACCTALGLT